MVKRNEHPFARRREDLKSLSHVDKYVGVTDILKGTDDENQLDPETKNLIG